MDLTNMEGVEGGEPARKIVGDCLTAMATAYVNYPDGKVKAPLTDWFDTDAQDTMDMGVSLEDGKFHAYSDIAIMQKEWYVENVLEGPFLKALSVLRDRGYLTPEAIEQLRKEGL